MIDIDKIRRSAGIIGDSEEIQEIFFQEIRFDPKLYKDGESKVNLLLKMENVHIFKQFQNDAGLVIELGRWGKKSNEKLS